MNESMLIIAGMLFGTYLCRLSFLAFARRVEQPPRWLEKALSYISPAVLVALITPAILFKDGYFQPEWRNPYLLGTLAVTLTMLLCKRNMLLAIILGFITFGLGRLVLPG